MKKLQDFMFLKDLFKYSKLKDFFKSFKLWKIKKWDYSYYQKIVSLTLIFFILFNLWFRIPFLQFFAPKANAENKDFFNIVSIIVDDDIYSSVDSKLKRYAKDIEWVLDNTKVVLIPTPEDASAFQVASLIESLYYEWYKSVKPDIDFESKLVWTLIVWDVPLPVVKNQENFSKTILPYTDFDNKTYVYNHEKEVYEKTENLNEKIDPEIWHWVISPNTWDNDDDIKAINDYFDKNHDFYIWKWLFGKKESFLWLNPDDESGKWLINWNPEEEPLESYVPYVFYFDQFREIDAINAINYNWYKAKEEYKEDLVYNRFSKDLAQDVKDKVLWKESEELTADIVDVFSWTELPNWDVIWQIEEWDPEPWEQANGNRYHFRFEHPGAYYGENITVYFDCNEYEFQVPNWAERMDMSDWRLWKPISQWGTNLVILWPADIELETATIKRNWWEETVTFTDTKWWLSDYQSDDAIKKSPDILSRYPTTENIKSFVEIFNYSALWELRKNIYNAWRYSEPKDKVNADFIPQLISVLDLISEQVIKNTNDKIEDKIDSVVKEWWSSKIIMFESFTAPLSGSTNQNEETTYRWNWITEKVYPLLKPIPFFSKANASYGLTVTYYNWVWEDALLFDQEVNDLYEGKTGRIYASLSSWWKKTRRDRLIGRDRHLVRDNAYFASDSDVYPWNNKAWRNYITCWDGKTYAMPKAWTKVYYSVVAFQDNQEKDWTSEAAFEFTKDVNLKCGNKWTKSSSSSSDSDEMTYTDIESCWFNCVRYENFFYGTRAADIEQARFCSIYRWSSKWTWENKWTLVEANRWYNINNLKPDYDNWWELCLGGPCKWDTACATRWIRWWNSPINMDDNIETDTETWASLDLWKDDPVSKNNNLYRLKDHNIKASITPLFDIVWSIKTTETCWAGGGDVRLVYRFSKKWDQYCWWKWQMCTVYIKCGWEIVGTKSFINPWAPPGNEPSNPGSPYRYPTDYAASKQFLWKSAADNAPHNLSILIAGDYADTCEVCVDGECHETAGRMDWEDSFVFSPLDCYEWVWIMTENSKKRYSISALSEYYCSTDVLAKWTVDFNDIFELLESLEKRHSKPTTSEESSSDESGDSEDSGLDKKDYKCKYSSVFIDWELVASYWKKSADTTDSEGWEVTVVWTWSGEGDWWCVYNYKTIPSYIKHDSPSSTTLSKQVEGIVTDAVPIDKDRYTDFIWRNLAYKKINYYPYLFRFEMEDGKENNTENVSTQFKELLDKTSEDINGVILNQWMPKLFMDWTWSQELYDLFESIYTTYMLSWKAKKTDLYKDFKDLKISTGSLDWGEKEISYLKTLEFALYWKNIDNISEKYAFIMDNYLSDQFTNTEKYWLPKNKKMYELSYMWAPWNATSMYVKMDPEWKTTWSPYTEEESENASLDSMLSWINLWDSYDDAGNSDDTGEFECGPPEWVPIWEWFPAIICWLGTVLPPTIKIWETECSTSSIFSDEEVELWESWWSSSVTTTTWWSSSTTWWRTSSTWGNLKSEEIKACNWDFDKNGINDCIEQSLASWSLVLKTDSTKYAYNSNWIIDIELQDKNNDVISADNSTTVNVELSQLDLLNSDWSKTNIFTSWIWTDEEIDEKRNNADKYINFNDSYIKISKWKWQYAFSAKNKDIDAYIKVFIELKDYKGTKKVYLEKIIKVEIRWNNFVATNYKIENEDSNINITSWVDIVLASDDTNIYLSDGKNTNIEDIKETIASSSKSKEKLIFSLENYSGSWIKVDLKYPLTVNLYDKKEKILTKYFNLSSIKEYASLDTLKKSGEYTLEVEDIEWFKFRKTFQVIADEASSGEITLWSNILEIWWVTSTNYLILYDKYWNLANSDLYTIEWEIDWDWVEFVKNDEDKEILNFQVLEWFKVFRTRTTDETEENDLIFKVKNSSGDSILEVKNSIKTVEWVHLFLQPLQTEIKVWTWVYWYNFSVRDDDWKIMTDFNSRLYLSLNSIYWKSTESFTGVNSWTWQVYFTTKTVADSQVKLSFQIEGLKNIYTKYIEILPEKPIKIDLILNKNKIEAKETDYATLKAELKDRYWNIVFNDNSTKLSLEIRSEYKDFLSISTWATATWITFRSSWSTYTWLPFVFSWTTFVSSWSTNSWEILLSSGSKFISSWSTFVASWSIVFKINATKIPGLAYIKVKADPWFESSFTIPWQTPFENSVLETMTGFIDNGELTSTWKMFFTEYDRYNYVSRFYKLEDLEKSEDYLSLPIDIQEALKTFWSEKNEIWVTAQDENIAKIETFYFWNKDKIDWNYYNSLYTVLLWAEYWDITQKDYLAWSILFDKNNRWLTVTSLLNNPYNYDDIVLINSNWKIETVQDNQNLTQDIWYISNLDSNKKLNFDIYNYALSEHLWKIYYNLDNWNDLKVCEWTGITFDDCSKDLENTTILLKGIQEGYTWSIDDDNLVLKNSFWEIIFKISEDWEISNNNYLSIENYVSEDDEEDSKKVIFSIKEWEDIVWIFSYNLIDSKLIITRDDKLLKSKITSVKNAIIVYLDSNKYWSRYFESKDDSALSIYYDDPFASESDLNIFSQSEWFTYESFKENYKAGWSESNKALLLYSAWETVWESTKKYASFSLINLWDPVVKLKNVKEKFPSDMEDCDKPPTCNEIEWIDAEQQWINFCDRQVKSDLDVKLNWGTVTLEQDITTILKDEIFYEWENKVPVVANPWVIYKENGKWKASTWERMRPNSKTKWKWDVFLYNKSIHPEDWQMLWFVMWWLIRLWVENNQPIKSKTVWMKWEDWEVSSRFGSCKEKDEDKDKKPSCNQIKWLSTDNVCDREIKSDLELINPDPAHWPGILGIYQDITTILKDSIHWEDKRVASVLLIFKKGGTWYGSAIERMKQEQKHQLLAMINWANINHKIENILPDDRKPKNWEKIWLIISDRAFRGGPWPSQKIRTEIAWMNRWDQKSLDDKWWCKITNNDNIVADFFKAIKWITSTDSDALQRLAKALRNIWYDAEAYLEPLWYVDKIQVGGAIYDVRVVDNNHTNRWNEIGPIRLDRYGDKLPPPWTCELEEEVIYRSFDSTIWKQISKDEKNISYKTFDYNNDTLQDVLLVKNDSYVEIIENRWKFDFASKWNLVYLPELWAGWVVEAWDFTWDWYDDIFFLAKWKPYLLNNKEKDFYKIPLEEQFNLSWSIIKISAFDMDNDEIKDIVTLDSEWKIHIFYWWWTPAKPEFTKLEVWDWYALYLNEEKEDWDGAIYYDLLDNNTTTSVLNNIKEENKTLVKDYEVDVDKKSINLQFADNIIYDKIYYNLNDSGSTDIFDDAKLQDDNFGNIYSDLSDWINDMEEYSNSNIEWGSNNVQGMSFVRNKYANSFWLDIKKEYKDLDEWKLDPLDEVKIVVNIKNTSWLTKNNVAYAEKTQTIFNFSEEESEVVIGKWTDTKTSTGANIRYSIWDYNFLIDWFSLAPWEEITIEYKATLLPLSYWDIETGYFEKGEDWDDEYGDIIVKTNKKACNANPDIFRSNSPSTWLTTTWSLVHTWSISDTTNYNWAYDVFIDWDMAYMTSFLSDRVNILDVSDPTNPVETWSIVDNGWTIKLDWATWIVKKGNYLYVASNLANTLQVIDISDSSNPTAIWQLVDNVALDWIRWLAFSDNYIYATVSNYDALQVIDISDPTSPEIVWTFRDTTTLNWPRDIKIIGNYAYISNYDGDGLSIINITNPENPILEWNITDTTTLNWARWIEISWNYAYVSAYLNNSIKVIDITNPENPESVTDISGGEYFIDNPIDLLVDWNKLYVTSFAQDAINIIDITNPEVPSYIKKIVNNDMGALLNWPVNIFKSWNFIYTTVYNSSALEIFNIFSPWRAYEKWIANSTCNTDSLELPEEFQKNWLDEDSNGVPDYIDELVESVWSEDKTKAISYATWALDEVHEDGDSDWVPDTEDATPSYDTEGDTDEKDFLTSINAWIDDVSEWIDKVASGLCNWFWWWWCITTPVNRAPLAPWNDLSVMGYPVWDWQKTWEWLPIFSAVLQTWCGYVKVWPPCPNWAWWRFDWVPKWRWENNFRLFVTPTITWAIWLAICFGKNNMSETESPPSLFPIIWIQWKCIIVAFPFMWCKWTWSDWDVQEQNYAVNFGTSWWWAWKEETRGEYWIANWNCVDTEKQAETQNFSFDENFMSNYTEYKQSWSEVAMSWMVNTFADIGKWTNNVLETEPLIELWDWTEHGDTVDVSFIAEIDVSALANWDFKDVIKLKNTLISWFPQFLMEWVNRQVEEIVTKLTSFPSLIVILPDFSWITDYKWGNFFDGIKDAFNEWEKEWADTEQEKSGDVAATQQEISDMNCSEKTISDDWYFECMTLQLQEQKQVLEKDFNPSQTTSWIKAVYDFIWSLPMVNLKSQTVNVNIPWITNSSLLKAKINFEITKKQWQNEIERVKNKRGSLDSAQKSIWDSIIVDAQALIRSLDKNLAIIEEYKKFPENLVKLLNKKEDRLNQILCSVDTIYKIFGWRLWDNGKRFKAWVELYVLIKAILKSWQIILDLFYEYESSCKECKNERYDLRTFIWRLVSMIIPKIPVIQFPKWPNIVIDLHNIKVWLDIILPEFNFNTRPIVIPSLPKLYLPDIPSVKIKLPTLPILPSLKIPELPDLPTLPSVELPNLPPPPKLPKILAVIETVIKILKIVTKIQCLLQKSPFAPEWTAWTKIAYLTDRQWFLPLDFLDVALPQFSFSFIDSIDITTYVNFEIEADFILEFVKQWVKPINSFTNDIVNIFNNRLPDLDFSGVLPDTINVDLWNTTGMLKDTKSTNINWEQVINNVELTQLNNLAKFLVYGFYNIYAYMQNNSDETVSNKEFISLVNKWLASKNLWSEENIGKLRNLWKDVSNMTYSKEDKFINELKEKNKAKFDTLKWIINTEKQVTKEQIKSIKNIENKSNIKFIDSINTSNVTWYNELMRKHNLETVKSTMNLLTDDNGAQKDLQQDWSKLLARVSTGLNSSMEKLLALNEQDEQFATTTATWIASTCSSGTWWEIYKYNYKWIYVVEKKEKLLEEMTPQEIKDEQNLSEEDKPKKENYRLFDYVEELSWSEEIRHVDFDNDKDEDILYMVRWELYIKENTKREVKKENERPDALVLDIEDNKFFNGDIFYEALNNVKETVSLSSYINFSFDAPSDESVNNFRLEFFTIIDKYLNENHDEYIPTWVKKNIIDSFADIDNLTKIQEESQTGYTISRNQAYIRNVWNTINDNVELTTKKAVPIAESLSSWSVVSLSVDTKLYAWRTPFIIWYYKWDSEEKQSITIGSYKNIKFNEKIKIFSIEWNAYVEWKEEETLLWQTIKNNLHLPMFSWTKIVLKKDNVLFNESSHIDIMYYDWTEVNIDFRDTKQYELHDLGTKKSIYMIYTKEDNDYYYSRILPFKEWIFWTRSSQVLLSPQVSSDKTNPEIDLEESIKIPIYQKYKYNFTPYLYDASWFSDFYIDMDLEVDSDNDWDATNDRDLDEPKVQLTTKTVKATFEAYEELFTKNIGLTLKDLAWNTTYKEVQMEVYAPWVEIDSYTWTTISWKLSDELDNQPVSLYRDRWWIISKIIDSTWSEKVYTNSSGAYTFSLATENKGLDITKSWEIVASINENTWKITIKNLAWANIKVIPANDTQNDKSYVKMILWDTTWDIFYQYFDFNWLWDLSVVNNFNDISTEWIYVKEDKEDYDYYQLPLTVPYNPWVISIYSTSDSEKKALFSIFPDWRIYTKDDTYKLEYSNYWDNIVFKLYDSKKDIYVWEVLMKVVEWNYIVK